MKNACVNTNKTCSYSGRRQDYLKKKKDSDSKSMVSMVSIEMIMYKKKSEMSEKVRNNVLKQFERNMSVM